MLKIFWFRKDLRIIDNKGLYEFIKSVSKEDQFSFLYIKNKNTFNYFGEKRISFLIECLTELKNKLKTVGFELQVIEGKSVDVFKKIVDEYKKVFVFCNRQIEPYCIARDSDIKEIVEGGSGQYYSYTDTTIFEPGEIKNGDGGQYKVFTPFKNQCLNILNKSCYKKFEIDLFLIKKSGEAKIKGFEKYNLEKEYKKLDKTDFLKGGREEGIKLLKIFYETGFDDYKTKRNFPSLKGTSLLSAHLHFGTVGIRECFRTAFVKLNKTANENVNDSIQTWIKELLWREFYYNITFHNPQITYESFKKEYSNIKWNYDETMFMRWCEGKTGYPIVDAGMRQLNKDGWMHNRVRMIVAMFLTKDLLIDWRLGEKYFAEKLIDLDFSNNNGGWQWSASTGIDAQPYFRIFNPYLQSKKFDAEGRYIKKYLPELKSVPAEFVHEPNLMSELEQKMYGVIIGVDYPAPIVEHKIVKDEAIKRYKDIVDDSML